MTHYFAKFRQIGDFWIRHNTRIYLDNFNGTHPAGHCLGAIIGKNPGSAKAAAAGWGPLALDGDKFLPNVHSILLKAFDRVGKTPPPDAYFQVLNLFYICGKDLKEATATLTKLENRRYKDPAESNTFPLVWFAWGGKSSKLDPFKKRLVRRHGTSQAFFYCAKSKSVIARPPAKTELARHTQGLDHEPLVSYIATHLE